VDGVQGERGGVFVSDRVPRRVGGWPQSGLGGLFSHVTVHQAHRIVISAGREPLPPVFRCNPPSV